MNTYFLGFPSSLGDPLSCLRPGLVESEKTSFTATLDELVGLCYELGVVNPGGDLIIRGDGVGCRVP